MSKYRVGEGKLPLVMFSLIFSGKTGWIISAIVLCTLVGCQHPTAACTGLNRSDCEGGLSLEEGEGAAAVRWVSVALHLWIAPPSAKQTLLLKIMSTCWKFSLGVLCHSLCVCLLPPLKDFLPWVLPLKSRRKPTNPVESAKAHILVEDDVDAAQPTSISLLTVLLGSCASFPSLSCGSEEAAAGTWRMSVQRMFAILGLFVASLFLK